MRTITSAVLSFPGLIPSDVSRPLSTYSTPFQANALWVKVPKKIFLPSIFLHTPFPRSSVRFIFLLAPVPAWHTMAPIKLRSTIIVVALLITSVAAGILFSPKPQSALLSSGHRLTLEKVTYGTNHLFSDYPHLLDQLYSTVPSLRRLVPLPSRILLNSSEPAVCLWLSEYDSQTNQYVSDRWQAIQVVDAAPAEISEPIQPPEGAELTKEATEGGSRRKVFSVPFFCMRRPPFPRLSVSCFSVRLPARRSYFCLPEPLRSTMIGHGSNARAEQYRRPVLSERGKLLFRV